MKQSVYPRDLEFARISTGQLRAGRFSRMTTAIPRSPAPCRSPAAAVIGSSTSTTDEAMLSSGTPSMAIEPTTGGRARLTETAAQVAIGPAKAPI